MRELFEAEVTTDEVNAKVYVVTGTGAGTISEGGTFFLSEKAWQQIYENTSERDMANTVLDVGEVADSMVYRFRKGKSVPVKYLGRMCSGSESEPPCAAEQCAFPF